MPVEHRIAELQNDVQQIDAQVSELLTEVTNLLGKRDKYSQAISILGGVPNPYFSPVGNVTFNPLFVPSFLAPEPDRMAAIDQAIANLPDRFTTTDVRNYVAMHFPSLLETVKGSYLPTRLSWLAEKGKLTLEASGKEVGEGGPNIWTKVNQSPP